MPASVPPFYRGGMSRWRISESGPGEHTAS